RDPFGLVAACPCPSVIRQPAKISASSRPADSILDARLSVFLAHRGGRDVPAVDPFPAALSKNPAASLPRLDRVLVLSARQPDPPAHPAFDRREPAFRFSPSSLAARPCGVSAARCAAVPRREGGPGTHGAAVDRARFRDRVVDRD